MTDTTSKPDTWQRAITRAQKAAIPIKHLGGEMWRAGSASRPGEGYTVIVREGMPVSCTCVGSYGTNVCQHRAAVLLVLQREAGWGAYAEGMVGM